MLNRIKKIISLFFIIIIILGISSCGSPAVAKIYGYENGNKTKLLRSVTSADEEFLIDLINIKTPSGYATGQEEPNFAIVYGSGTDNEYMYLIIADLETDTVTYITDSQDQTMPTINSSYTTALDFYDFVGQD